MKFAYRKEFATEPLAEALRRRGWETIAVEHPEELIATKQADIVFTPPLDYALALGLVDFALVPGIAIMTRGLAGLVRLVFNKGLQSFESIAVKNPLASETVIAVMLLVEKHDIELKIIHAPPEATIDQMLAVADAALLVGDDAIFNIGENTTVLDLADEWEDVVESPFPYMVAWGRVGEVPEEALADLFAARDEAVLLLADFAAQHPLGPLANGFYQCYLRGEIGYMMTDADIAALDAFFRYTFYYSIIPDMPAIKFLPNGAPADLPTAR